MRTIKKIHPARYCPIEDLIAYSPLSLEQIGQIDPFLQLNHYGPQQYIPNNNGLPFIPHPHRGIETVTIVLDGEIIHRDSNGNQNMIKAGGVQWMTAGKGIIHEETSSENFMEWGGKLEILQIWINLPAKYKMVNPRYICLTKEQLPEIKTDQERVEIILISGGVNGYHGVVETYSDITLSLLIFKHQGRFSLAIKNKYNIFFYLVKGMMEVNHTRIKKLSLVEFNMDHERIDMEALQDCILLLGYASPLREPTIVNGPFVMNNLQEIRKAYTDYHNGKMGRWQRSSVN